MSRNQSFVESAGLSFGLQPRNILNPLIGPSRTSLVQIVLESGSARTARQGAYTAMISGTSSLGGMHPRCNSHIKAAFLCNTLKQAEVGVVSQTGYS